MGFAACKREGVDPNTPEETHYRFITVMDWVGVEKDNVFTVEDRFLAEGEEPWRRIEIELRPR